MYLASIFGISGVLLLSVSCAPHFGYNPYWWDDSSYEMDPWWNDWSRPPLWFDDQPYEFIATPHPFIPYHERYESFPGLFNDDWSRALDNMQKNLNELRDVSQQFSAIVPTISMNETAWFDDLSNNRLQNISGEIGRDVNNKTIVETKVIDGHNVTIKESTINSNKDGVKKFVHESEIYFDDKFSPKKSWWDNWFNKEGEDNETPKPRNWLGRLWDERRRREDVDESTSRNWLGRFWNERRARREEDDTDPDTHVAKKWLRPLWRLWNGKRNDVEDDYDWLKPAPKHHWWGYMHNKDGSEVDERSIRDYADTGLFNLPLGRR